MKTSRVYRSIIHRDFYLGLSLLTVGILGGLAWLFAFVIKQPIFLVVPVALGIVINRVNKRDEFFVEILIENLIQPDVLNV
jgi:type IV secretory pathway VirB3-like protein